MRHVVTGMGFTKLRDNADGSETYSFRVAIHRMPRWHHLFGVPIAVWLGFRIAP